MTLVVDASAGLKWVLQEAARALATGAAHVVVADGPFVKAMARHPDPVLAGMLLPLDEWAKTHGGPG